jgi:S-DNA-T family DNA segregation ATPase FtsK/SpoIIIE
MTIFGVGCFTTAGFVLLSFFTDSDVLVTFNGLVVKYFGWGSIFFPFILGSLGVVSISRRKKRTSTGPVPLGSSLLLLACLGLTASFTPDRSGKVGCELWFNLVDLVTAFGAFILLFAAALIGLTVLFNTSLDELLSGMLRVGNSFYGFIKAYLIRGILTRRKPIFVQKELPLKVTDKQPALKERLENRRVGRRTGISAQTPAELEPALVSNLPVENQVWKYPPTSFLSDMPSKPADRGDIKKNAAIIEKTLESFGITARVAEVNLGPAVTQYALEIAMGTKLSKITALGSDLALALAAPTGQIRIEAPIPGRSLVGIEIPNRSLEIVTLKNILVSPQMQKAKSKLTVGLGLDVSGNTVVANLARMPHVLIAGATGSGKTVCLNSFIAALLFRTTPNEVKLIVVDPKRVEMTAYNGIPHLLTPVIVDIDKTLSALKWTIAEMDRRYKLFANAGARNIDAYNELSGFQALPYIVVIVDELADLMAFAPVEFEDAITRLAQMSRATGIHLVISTQRPSVDVITGLIKANIPCRVAFNVSSMVDSRVILDAPGAEKLLGRGDMLYIPPDQAKPTRIQGAFVSDKEVKALVEFLKKTGVAPQYTQEVTETFVGKITSSLPSERDELFEEAVRLVCEYDRASASLLQRRLKIGYARAARILDQLEAVGIVGPPEGSKPRDVLIRNAKEFLAQQVVASNNHQ